MPARARTAALGVLLAGLLLGSGCAEAPAGAGASEASPAPVAEAAAVRFGGLADVRAAIQAQRGQALLVNFWATWCPPCVAELPALREVAQEFEPKGARILGVSFDLLGPGLPREQAVEKVRSFLAARELVLPTLIFEPAEYAALSQEFQLPGAVPVTLAFDRKGTLVDHHLGEASRERFREMLTRALAP